MKMRFILLEDMFRVLDEEREISKALIGPNGDMGVYPPH